MSTGILSKTRTRVVKKVVFLLVFTFVILAYTATPVLACNGKGNPDRKGNPYTTELNKIKTDKAKRNGKGNPYTTELNKIKTDKAKRIGIELIKSSTPGPGKI